MCEHGTTREITIERRVAVDACLAQRIVLLNRLGVYTTGCCCGHGAQPATATILPSSAERAAELGFTVMQTGGDPLIQLQDLEVTETPQGTKWRVVQPDPAGAG